MWEARTKYYGVGLELGLPSDAIDAIEKSNHHKVEPIYTEMIKECLKQGLVTQKKLAEAVSSQLVDYKRLSDGILAKKFTASKTAPRKSLTPYSSPTSCSN